ncbi:MAG: 16S rRNA (adenine(1518)-N(6)/adenine(1519)-N(6))-dimethyltransferase RsmA [Thermoplasmata archaeon]
MTNGIKGRLKELGLRPSKNLGQHFLVDSGIALRQIEAANISSKDTVLEIGPGLGILTEEIVKRAKKTVVIEKDAAFKGYLEGKFIDFDLEVIHGDALEVDFPEFDRIVSNVPFNISSPLTFKLLEYGFDLGILMYQKEFADRMVASVGEPNYSRLSVMVSSKADANKLFNVHRNRFYPPPRVDAAVIELIPRRPPYEISHENTFQEVVRELFNYRRKTIKNALKCGFGIDVKNMPFKKYRVENLSPKDINRLVNTLVERGMLE